MNDAQIRVTIRDLVTGEEEAKEIGDDYIIVCAGACYVDGIQAYANGTHVLTVKGRKDAPLAGKGANHAHA